MALRCASGVLSLTVLLLTLMSGTFSRSTARKPKAIPVIYDVGVCTDKKHHIEIYNVTTIMDEWGANYVTADILFRKGMKNTSKFVVIITKCTGAKSPNLCEYYLRWVWTAAICRLIPTRGMIWSPIYDTFEPPYTCPVPPGHFLVRNATVDVDAAMALMPDKLYKYIWPVEVQLYDEHGEMIVCFVATGEARYAKGSTGHPS
ncbi:uncharacterized protein LOC117644975 [Thrips palmi]|uniref:Uncharacterized protein LOC117644975 n=1 Tax=Thrips palmi TaxID=161013 RepID=A0A6P8ZMJ8_THRPL|nr:uncharacterized protein LOC117644975 [Thrips palmi]